MKTLSDPIIFLDVDGVLNHRGVFFPGNGPDPLCPKCVERFLRLVEGTEARVVVSSTWRLGIGDNRPVQKLKRACVLDRMHDDWRTVDLPNRIANGVLLPDQRRGREIAEWLGRHPEVDRYVILDDDSDMLPEQMSRFVQTSFDSGLLDTHVLKASVILTRASVYTSTTERGI
jgi:hypothetical protein